MCYWQIQRAPHGRPWPIVVENAWHVGQHDRHQVCLLELKRNNNENMFVLQKFHINVTINGHQVKITIMVEKSFLHKKLWWMAIGCFVWRVTFGENTIRRGSASPYSQGRKLADTRLVGSCQVTWFHLIAVPWKVVGIYAKCQGRKLQVWSWPYSGESNLGCVVSHRQLFLSQDAVVTTLGTFQLIKGVVDPMKDQVSEAILKIKLSPLDSFS